MAKGTKAKKAKGKGKTEDRRDDVTCGDFGGKKENGEPCTRKAGWGVEGGSGKCRNHINTSPFCNISHPKKRAFLVNLSVTGHRGSACTAAGVSRQVLYTKQWLEDEDFQEAYKEALYASGDVLEDEAHRRGIVGIKRLKYHNGKVLRRPDVCICGHDDMQHPSGESCTKRGCGCKKFKGEPYYEHSYSDTLLIVLLKMRKRFEDKTHLEHSGSIVTGLEGMTDAELAEHGAALAARVRKGAGANNPGG